MLTSGTDVRMTHQRLHPICASLRTVVMRIMTNIPVSTQPPVHYQRMTAA